MLSLTFQVVEKNVSLLICTITLSSLHEEFIRERKTRSYVVSRCPTLRSVPGQSPGPP